MENTNSDSCLDINTIVSSKLQYKLQKQILFDTITYEIRHAYVYNFLSHQNWTENRLRSLSRLLLIRSPKNYHLSWIFTVFQPNMTVLHKP